MRGDPASASGWAIRRRSGSPADLHSELGAPRRGVTICRPDRAALVLGSLQPESDVDRYEVTSAGLEVVRRRSGGAAVLVVPGELAWIDVSIARGDALWDDDVVRSSYWLGDVWSSAVRLLGAGEVSVHRGPMLRTRWSPKACFAGVAPGELLLDGHKVVGISQRRTRDAALFHCAALLSWDPSATVRFLDLDDGERAEAVEALGATAGALRGVGMDDVEESFLRYLPRP